MEHLQTKDIIGQYLRLTGDAKINTMHLSIYMSFIYLWQESGFAHPITITRKGVMKLAHINSFTTYHKCIRQLVDYGYIVYTPSYNYYKKTTIAFAGYGRS